MEAGVSPYDLWVVLEPAAALGLHLFQLVQRGKDPIRQRLVGKRPEPFSGLHLRGIGWQEHDAGTGRTDGSFVLKKAHHFWIWIALCRKTRQMVDSAVGDRSKR